MTRRSQLEIVIVILKICRRGASKTRIVYRANLNFLMLKQYARLLLEKDLLAREGNLLKTTQQGLRLLQQGQEILPQISA